MLNQGMYEAVRDEVTAAKATLVAITKQRPISVIERMYALGQRDFGENRVSELLEKKAALPADIRWHFIGHLQRNKVKQIAPFVHLIHSGDSPRLIREINKEAKKNERIIPVLIQFHIAAEESKYGLSPNSPLGLFDDLPVTEIPNVQLAGVMGMATYTDIDEQIAEEFESLASIFATIKSSQFPDNKHFSQISMGMSGDYPIALQQGSTLVRVGSLLYQ